jgi:hypothetical protein
MESIEWHPISDEPKPVRQDTELAAIRAAGIGLF